MIGMGTAGKKIIIATRNAGKKREFAQMLAPLGYHVESLADHPELPDIEETGSTFIENAGIKARTAAEHLRAAVIADDSGLAVELLDGAPGVYSARYAGPGAADGTNIRKLLDELEQRGALDAPIGEATLSSGSTVKLLSKAAFICAVVYYDPTMTNGSDAMIVSEGRLEGYIIDQPSGSGGFGYDPVFYVPQYGRTMAELSSDEKNAISHRGQALRQLLDELRSRLV